MIATPQPIHESAKHSSRSKYSISSFLRYAALLFCWYQIVLSYLASIFHLPTNLILQQFQIFFSLQGSINKKWSIKHAYPYINLQWILILSLCFESFSLITFIPILDVWFTIKCQSWLLSKTRFSKIIDSNVLFT